MQVFYVRKGRVMGQRGSIVDKVEDVTQPDLIARIIEDLYHQENPIGMPKNVFVPRYLTDKDSTKSGLPLNEVLALKYGYLCVGTSERCTKLLHETQRVLCSSPPKRGTDHNSRGTSVARAASPWATQCTLRIECYDMSHLQGTDYVGSMVVLEDAVPRKSEYRRFKIRDVAGNDDFAAMEEVLYRRFRNLLAEEKRRMKFLESSPIRRSFWLLMAVKGSWV